MFLYCLLKSRGIQHSSIMRPFKDFGDVFLKTLSIKVIQELFSKTIKFILVQRKKEEEEIDRWRRHRNSYSVIPRFSPVVFLKL